MGLYSTWIAAERTPGEGYSMKRGRGVTVHGGRRPGGDLGQRIAREVQRGVKSSLQQKQGLKIRIESP